MVNFKRSYLNMKNRKRGNMKDKKKEPQTDKPEEGKIYALTGVRDSKCILNGYSWKESEVKEEDEKIHNRS